MRLVKNRANIPKTKKYIIVLTFFFVRYDKFENKKNNGSSKNDSFLPICILASAVFSEYKKLMAYNAQKAMDIK